MIDGVLRSEWKQGAGEHHYFETEHFTRFSKWRININDVVRLLFIWGRGILCWVFVTVKPKTMLLYSGTFKIVRKQNSSK